MSELPQLVAAMHELCITPRAQRQIVAACDAALTAQLRADAERLSCGQLVTLWRDCPVHATPLLSVDESTEPLPVSP